MSSRMRREGKRRCSRCGVCLVAGALALGFFTLARDRVAIDRERERERESLSRIVRGEPHTFSTWLGETWTRPADGRLGKSQEGGGNSSSVGAQPVVKALVSWTPRVFLVSELATAEERKRILKLAEKQVDTRRAAGASSGGGVVQRTMLRLEDSTVAQIIDRAAILGLLPADHVRSFVVSRGEPSGQCHELRTLGAEKKQDYGLALEVLIVLASPNGTADLQIYERGNATDLVSREGRVLTLEGGGGAMLYSLANDGREDSMAALVQVCTPDDKTWLALISFAALPKDAPWVCEDLSPNCEDWAARGNCETDAEFMIADGVIGNCLSACGLCPEV